MTYEVMRVCCFLFWCGLSWTDGIPEDSTHWQHEGNSCSRSNDSL